MNKIIAIKILLIGDSGVGKTAILHRFADDVFNPTFIATIGIDFKIKLINIDGRDVKLQIWDTAGQERFRQTLMPTYYRNADGVLLVFDVTNPQSLENISTWIKNIEQNATAGVEKMLIANKCDLIDRRLITVENLSQYSLDRNMEWAETSAKTGQNVQDAFYKMASKILAKKPMIRPISEIVDPAKPNFTPSSSCKNDEIIKITKKQRAKLKFWKKRCRP